MLLSAFAAIVFATSTPSAPDPGAVHEHARRSITILLRAPVDEAFDAFGVIEEKKWSPGWNPRFVFPTEPVQAEGGIFVVPDGASQQVWLIQTWDVTAHVARYAAIDPGMTVTLIQIRVTPLSGTTSSAFITYERTGLSEAGDAQTRHFDQHFAASSPHWEQTINDYLRTRR